ncbi:MAG TPA: FCD domain-containing protein [Candidatus Dormibacteraeota bacterium]|nr:FCD domain-containing protein [Candidatus Dormibacteraeota bacterium]
MEQLRPLRGERLFEQVANLLESEIGSGRLRPGHRLPTESDLARQLDVGRSAVREALKTLELKGLLEVRRGYRGGTFVRHPEPDAAPHELHTNPGLDADVFDVLTVRGLLEPAAARLAAERASEDARLALGQLVRMERASQGRPAVFIGHAATVHVRLAELSGNGLLQGMIDSLRPLIRRDLNSALQVPRGWQAVTGGHELLVGAVGRGETESAESAMRAHLATLTALLLARREVESGQQAGA